MSFKSDFDGRASERTKAQGEALFDAGLVTGMSASQAGLSATVLAKPRSVRVAVRDSGECSCSCSTIGRGSVCEHLWAFFCQIDYDTSLLGGSAWKFALDRLVRSETVTPMKPREEMKIRYAFSWRGVDKGSVGLRVLAQTRRQDGAWGSAKILKDYETLVLPADDEDIISCLRGPERRVQTSADSWRNSYDRRGAPLDFVMPVGAFIMLLQQLVETDRLFIAEEKGRDSHPVSIDSGPPFVARVRLEGEEKLGLTIAFHRGEETVTASDIDFSCGEWILVDHVFHRVTPPDAVNWIDWSAENEVSIRPDEADRFFAAAQETKLGRMMDAPPGWEEIRPEGDAIQPVLLLRSAGRQKVAARVGYDYGAGAMTADDPMRLTKHEERQVVLRNEAREAELLRDFHLSLTNDADMGRDGDPEFRSADIPALVSRLQEKGWRAEVDGTALRGFTGSVASVKSGIDWFDLEGGLQYDDEIISYPDILRALKSGARTVTLGDGSQGLLPEEWLRRQGLLGAAEIDGDVLRFRQSQGMLLDMLLEAAPQPDIDEHFQRIREALSTFESPQAVQEPEGFHGELRAYQREGLGWIHFLERHGFGGCLADDMGLGKTVQVLAYLQGRMLNRAMKAPTLVVAPRSVASNWIAEARRFTPELLVLDYSGPDRRALQSEFQNFDVVVTTYGLMRRDIQELKDIDFGCVVLDESQAIKNAKSQTAKASRLLRAQQRLALSGTPIENHIDELWSLFEFLNPGMFSTIEALKSFEAEGEEGNAILARALRPFILRRKKEEVAENLPARSEQTLVCELPKAQRKVYDDLLKHYRAHIAQKIDEEGLGRAKMHVLEALTRLRQASCHPALLDAETEAPSAKTELLVERLQELISEGHKALVFSQFTKFLALVKTELDAAGITYEYLDGRSKKREQLVQRFQEDENCPVFLISLKAGGTGLNLTAADYVFLLDPWWNPAVEAQAIDRAHRIGQTRNVFAYRLIAKDTIEEKILALQEKKRALAESILSGGSTTLRDLTREDLELLLS